MSGIFQILAGGGGANIIQLVISTDTANYDMYANRGPNYVAGSANIRLTINSGVVVYSTSTGSPALTTGSSWTAGDILTIINNGTILGRGGAGGNGSTGGTGGTGGSGGGALQAQFAVSIDNQNRIAGGGGGAGGGGSNTIVDESGPYTGGSGGGGGGIGNGPGGTGSAPSAPPSAPAPKTPGQNGTAGTLTAAGGGGEAGVVPVGVLGGNGGSGGSYGSSGGGGGSSPFGPYKGGTGGAAGYAITGNPFVNYINVGTINGSVS